jgi:riboflavin synthase
MFTGIIEELGEVAAVDDLAGAPRLSVLTSTELVQDAKRGDSYAISGVCLTVTGWRETGGRVQLDFDVMTETLNRSSLAGLRAGDPVNVERPVRLSDRLGGHLVQGHVDGVGEILDRQSGPGGEIIRVSLPAALSRYLVEKGSITVDGVSLTVVYAGPDAFTVSLIPETLARTTLGSKQRGALVNLEVDVLAKYTERLLAAREVRA